MDGQGLDRLATFRRERSLAVAASAGGAPAAPWRTSSNRRSRGDHADGVANRTDARLRIRPTRILDDRTRTTRRRTNLP